MTPQERKVMQLAWQALTVLLDEWTPARQAQLKGMDALTAIEEALAQPEQRSVSEHLEPVAWMTPDGEGFRIRFSPPVNDVPLGWDALYLAPPQHSAIARSSSATPLKPLTDEEILAANYPDGEENGPTIAAPDFELICFARHIEAAHNIKE